MTDQRYKDPKLTNDLNEEESDFNLDAYIEEQMHEQRPHDINVKSNKPSTLRNSIIAVVLFIGFLNGDRIISAYDDVAGAFFGNDDVTATVTSTNTTTTARRRNRRRLSHPERALSRNTTTNKCRKWMWTIT